MKIETIENPEPSLIEFFNDQIASYNDQHWKVKEREKSPIAIKVTDDQGEVLAGAAGKTFGNWLMIDNLWVSEKLRGQDIGSKVLRDLEAAAKKRGCQFAVLDTLNFQARPFYEKYGYSVQWTQENYPLESTKYHMTKEL